MMEKKAAPLLQRARELRAGQTAAERHLWSQLRYALPGMKFRRQFVIGPAIADFCCPAARLVVEVDGPIHDSLKENDANRDFWMRERGYRVLRFTNDQVMHDTTRVMNAIRKELAASRMSTVKERSSQPASPGRVGRP